MVIERERFSYSVDRAVNTNNSNLALFLSVKHKNSMHPDVISYIQQN